MGYDAIELATSVVGSGLSVSEWCGANGIGKTSVYRALNWCRLNDPSVFGAGEGVAVESGGKGPWYSAVRKAMGADSGGGAFVEIGTPSRPTPAGAAPIVVEMGCDRVTLPAGSDARDVASALSATALALGVSG